MDNGYNCTQRPCYQYFNQDAGWDRKFYLTPNDLCTATFGGSVISVEEGSCYVQWPGGIAQHWHYSLYTHWRPVIELEADHASVASDEGALPFVAKIRRVDEPLAQTTLKVELKSSTGTVSVLYGATGNDGRMPFRYLPAGRPIKELMVASCDICAEPPAKKEVEVFGGAMCGRDAGSLLGNPIHLPTAEKVQSTLDWTDEGPHPLNFVRHYRSGGVSGPWDAREYWGHNYNARLLRSTPTERILVLGDGTGILLRKNQVTEAWESHTGKDTLIESPGGPTVVRSDDSRWLFDNETGLLLSMTARNGWTTTLAYDDGRLVRVTR